MTQSHFLVLASLACAFPLFAQEAATPPPAPPASPSAVPAVPVPAADKKPDVFNAREFMNGYQVSRGYDNTWFTPEIISKLEAAEKKWPADTTVRAFMGRIAGHEKNVAKAESYLIGNPAPLAREYLLEVYLENELKDKYCAEFDRPPSPNGRYAGPRLKFALESKDYARAEKLILETHSPLDALNKILEVGVKDDQILWTYEALGRLALRVPADEQGSKILTRIFAERDKLKVLFPNLIR